jgi:hypothetical protein
MSIEINYDDLEFEDTGPSVQDSIASPDVKTLTDQAKATLAEQLINYESDPHFIERARVLREKYSIKTLIAAFYMSYTGAFTCPAFEDNATLHDFVLLSDVLSSLKGSIPNPAPLHLQERYDHNLSAMISADNNKHILKAALSDFKPPVVQYMTGEKLIDFAYDLVGAVGSSKHNADGTSHWIISVPELPELVVECGNGKISMIVKNGKKFVDAVNTIYKTHMEYIDLDADQLTLALFMSHSYKLIKDKETEDYRLLPLQVVDPLKYQAPYTSNAEVTWQQAVVKTYMEMVRAKRITLPILPVKSNPRFCMEYLIWELCKNPDFRNLVTKLSSHLRQRNEKVHIAINTLLKTVENPKNVTTPFMASSQKDPKSGKPVMTAGDVRDFRDSNNSSYRATRQGSDLTKSDSVEGSGFAHSKSSVPFKAAVGLEWLRKLGVDLSKVDAYGVGHCNHWHREIMSRSGDVKWYDVDHIGALPLGGQCERRDATDMPEGCGVGRVICDDSCPPDPLAKIDAILRAGYEAGFIKLMFGWGRDRAVATRLVPPDLDRLSRSCNYVDFYRVSPHSEEYYVIFVRKGGIPIIPTGPDQWSTPLSDVRPVSEGPLNIEQWGMRARMWRYMRGLEIYASNIARSVCAMAGAPPAKLPTIYDGFKFLVTPSVVLGSGAVVKGRINNSAAALNREEQDGGEMEF